MYFIRAIFRSWRTGRETKQWFVVVFSRGQITSDKFAGTSLRPHPPSERPVTPRTPRTTEQTALQSSLHAQVTIDESARPADGCSTPRSDTVAAGRGQPQKRSPPVSVHNGDEVTAGCEADDDGEDRRTASASKRRRSANIEVCSTAVHVLTLWRAEVSTGYTLPSRSNLHF